MSKKAKVPVLSKSRLLSADQCLKMLHMEWHHPNLAVVSEDTQAAFRMGHAVGAVAKQIYGTEESVEIEYRRGDKDTMRRETAERISRGAAVTIFETT